MKYTGKKIVVVGLGQSGLATVDVLCRMGAEVLACDNKDTSELKEEIAIADACGAKVLVGTNDVELDGVDFVVASPGVPSDISVFKKAKVLGIEVIAEIELAYRISNAPIIAITGTNGKTTTTILIGEMLKKGKKKAYVAGNVSAGDIKMPLVSAAYKAKPNEVIVAEISSFQLENINTFKPHIALFLNLTADHMNRHSGMEEYGELKSRIFKNQNIFDFAIINAENDYTAALTNLGANTLRFGKNIEPCEGAFVEEHYVCTMLDGKKHIICDVDEITLPGEHNLENVLAASAAATAFGVDVESIKNAIVSFKPIPHRMEPIATVNGVEYINNSMCTNVDAAIRSTLAIKREQIIIAGGKDKGSDFTPLGETFAKQAKYVILIGTDAGIIEKSMQAAGFSNIVHEDSLPAAVKTASAIADEGDVVILTPACASFDMFTSFEDRGDTFRKAVIDLSKGFL